MPELPEVETMCRGLVGVVGQRIVAATLPRSRVRPLSVQPAGAVLVRRLAGRTIAGVHRRGKRVVIEVTAAAARPREWLVIEPRMTGQMLVVDPPTEEHVRLVVQLAGGAVHRFLFWDRRGLGTIRLLDDRGLEAACGAAKLGPDGLVVTGDDLATRLGRSRRAVKAALLDQRAVAGIGNIYASEILHRVAIHPRTTCRRVRRTDWERIAAATVQEMKTLVENATITAPFDGTITRRYLEPGDFGAPGRPLFSMEDSSLLRLEINVAEALSGTMAVGGKLRVEIGGADADFEGVISEVAPSADVGSRTFLVKLDLPQNDALRAGQFGRAFLPRAKRTALSVPDSALISRGQMEYVFVSVDGVARLRIVRTGQKDGGETEILAGLESGESVVPDPPAAMRDGQPLLSQP
jgi:formamidopyrimidine-DNA glycosylase